MLLKATFLHPEPVRVCVVPTHTHDNVDAFTTMRAHTHDATRSVATQRPPAIPSTSFPTGCAHIRVAIAALIEAGVVDIVAPSLNPAPRSTSWSTSMHSVRSRARSSSSSSSSSSRSRLCRSHCRRPRRRTPCVCRSDCRRRRHRRRTSRRCLDVVTVVVLTPLPQSLSSSRRH